MSALYFLLRAAAASVFLLLRAILILLLPWHGRLDLLNKQYPYLVFRILYEEIYPESWNKGLIWSVHS